MYAPDTLTLYRCVFYSLTGSNRVRKGATDVYRVAAHQTNTPADLIH